MIIALFLFIYVVTTGVQAFLPSVVKSTTAFGVTFPPQQSQHVVLTQAKKNYSKFVCLLSFIGIIVIFVLATVVFQWHEEQVVIMIIVVMLFVQIVAVSIYMYFHKKIHRTKQQENWFGQVKQVRVVDLTARQRDAMLPTHFYLVLFLFPVVLFLYLMRHYALLPDAIPIHFNFEGKADQFLHKNYSSVLALPFFLLMQLWVTFGMFYGLKRSAIVGLVNAKEASITAQLRLRKYMSYYFFVLAMSFILLVSYMGLALVHHTLAKPTYVMAIFMGFAFINTLTTIALFSIKKRCRMLYEQDIVSNLADVDDDQYWWLGFVYCNRKDSSVFLEKRLGLGWTLNLGNTWSYILVVLPVILMIVMGILIGVLN